MAIDARILLQKTTPDASGLAQNIAGLGQQFRQAKATSKKERGLAEAEELLTFQSLAQDPRAFAQAVSGSSILEADSKKRLIADSKNPDVLGAHFNKANRMLGVKGVGATEKFSPTTLLLPNGTSVQTTNTGRKVVTNAQGQVLEGPAAAKGIMDAERFKTEEQIKRSGGQAAATARQARISAMKKDFGERLRGASRSEVGLREALTLAQNAEQGFSGAAKLRLSKILPGIDVSNEASLDSALTALALDQLQKFKGPTTDFEFGVTQSIAGKLGNSKSSNIARINSLERARWFNERESRQFNKHIASGGDPDAFAFNFGQEEKTKRGIFTLRDLQDTAVANNISINEVIKRLNK